MAAKLSTSYYAQGALAWNEDGDEGAVVGQEGADIEALRARYAAVTDPEERTYFAVEIAVAEFASTCVDAEYVTSKGGWVFETNTSLKRAMAIAKAAEWAERLACKGSTASWPEWAKTALAAGWKAPKGWKP